MPPERWSQDTLRSVAHHFFRQSSRPGAALGREREDGGMAAVGSDVQKCLRCSSEGSYRGCTRPRDDHGNAATTLFLGWQRGYHYM